ncbi:MAG TPA: CpsB/CapC family capsule biosynthesis tyrosine phosphatase [Thermoanaerobaculia bacterium]|jgi:protein-tyrosine phosphatase|nr:CpsB/CapC family capsule biosynthesis tyrosine phosphatase [Thermoanaerobaculia bacterium]
MIDLHHHCLPGVDDGPASMAEAIDLCKMAADEGIETIVATPHVLRGRWRNRSRAEYATLLDDLRSKTGTAPRLLLGSEYFFAHDMDDMLRNESILPLAGSRYVLVEFASHAVPPLVREPLYRAQLEGWTPLIAHPERNLVFRSNPEILASLLRIGVKIQVTTGSLTGGFGKEAEAASIDWLQRGWIHVMATDAHNTTKRPPGFQAARRRVVELVGEEIAQALFTENPKSIVENRGLVYDPDIPDVTGSKSEPLFTRIRKFFSR